MSKTKTAIVELYRGDSGKGWHPVSTHLVPIHLTRKDDYDKKWYYFKIPLRYKGKLAGYHRCKFQEHSNYVFTKDGNEWQGNIQVGMYPDVWQWVKILSLDFSQE